MKKFGFVVCTVLLSLAFPAHRGMADSLYVWSDNGSILDFNAQGQSTLVGQTAGVALATNGPSSTVGLAVDNLGYLYSGNPSNSTITKYFVGGQAFLASVDSISGLAFHPTNGYLYGSVPNFNSLVDGPNASQYLTNQNLNFPTAIAFNTSGNLFVANTGGNNIQEFTSAGTFIQTFASNLSKPDGLAFDSTGNLYVANNTANSILKITPNGTVSTFADSLSGLSRPESLAIDGSNHLFVANNGASNILKYSLFTPEVSSVFASGLVGPESLAFSSLDLAAVPEPSTVALLGFGALLLAAQWRRLRDRSSPPS